MNIQAPPNLSPGVYPRLIAAGINDWGGVSPVTPDHVNPEAPWPRSTTLARRTAEAGQAAGRRGCRSIRPMRRTPRRWLAPEIATRGAARRAMPRAWRATTTGRPAATAAARARRSARRARPIRRLDAHRRAGLRGRAARRRRDRAPVRGARCRLSPRDRAPPMRCAARSAATSCATSSTATSTTPTSATYRCRFCAFSKGKTHEALRGTPYDLALDEIVRRAERGLGARRHRSLPAGRHPSRLHRRDLSRHLPRHEGGGAGHAHPCLLAAGGDAGRGDARPVGAGVPGGS